MTSAVSQKKLKSHGARTNLDEQKRRVQEPPQRIARRTQNSMTHCTSPAVREEDEHAIQAKMAAESRKKTGLTK
jgi:hypothetical protein